MQHKHFRTLTGETLAQKLSKIIRQYEKRMRNGENADEVRNLVSESLKYFGEIQAFDYR